MPKNEVQCTSHLFSAHTMIIFLYGKDTFRSKESLRKMIAKFKTDRDPSGYNVIHLDALTEKPRVIMTELHGVPFLAEKRMVIIEHALESKHAELHEKIQHMLSQEHEIPATTICVLYEKIDTHKAKLQKELLKKLGETKYAQRFDLLTGSELKNWIITYAKERGLELDRISLDYITTHSKGDTWFLHSLIEQLAQYCAHTPCSLDIVKLFLRETGDDNIFNLIDAIVTKKPERVFSMIREQYEKGEDAQYIFAMLIRQFRIMLELKDVLTRSPATPLDVLATSLGLHPFVVKKTIPLLHSYPLDTLKKFYTDLLTLDHDTKTGKGSMPVSIDVLVGKICTL